MAPENATAPDVHVHGHRANFDHQPGNRPDFGPGSTRTAATRDARVIQLHPDLPQEDPQKKIKRGSGGLAAELQAGLATASSAADASDWARPAMTAVEAWRQVAPAKGEAGNWIIWIGMTAAGLARAAGVSLGYLITLGFDTRIKAAVAAGILTLTILLAALAQAGR